MKLKVSLLAILFCSAAYISNAQTTDEEADAVVTLLGSQKKEIIAKLVQVSGKDSVAFWKIYDEYTQSNKLNGRNRIKLYERTAQAYAAMTPALADSLAGRYFDNRISQEKNLEEYYKKVKAATNPITAFQFYQAEVYLLTALRSQIMAQVPTYGEVLAVTKKK